MHSMSVAHHPNFYLPRRLLAAAINPLARPCGSVADGKALGIKIVECVKFVMGSAEDTIAAPNEQQVCGKTTVG
jgi:hypothetical protein